MASNINAKKLGSILDRCTKAITDRKSIEAPISFAGAGRDEIVTWAGSPVGQATIKEFIAALRAERKALKGLLKSARKVAKAAPKTETKATGGSVGAVVARPRAGTHAR